MEDIYKEALLEKYPPPITIDSTRKILEQMENCICKINNSNGKGTGFFCYITDKDKKKFPVLITNNHVINEKIINECSDIKVILNNKTIKIKIDDKRKIYTSPDTQYDTTIIEIRPEKDLLNKEKYFLELDDNIIDEDPDLRNKFIYILQYSKYHYDIQKAAVSYGILKGLDLKTKYNINYLCSTEKGASGSPILNLSNYKVIGIHKQATIFNYNAGTFLKYSIQDYLDNKGFIEKINNDEMRKFQKKAQNGLSPKRPRILQGPYPAIFDPFYSFQMVPPCKISGPRPGRGYSGPKFRIVPDESKKRINCDFRNYYKIIRIIKGYKDCNPLYEAIEKKTHEKRAIKIFYKENCNLFGGAKDEDCFFVYKIMREIVNVNTENQLIIYEYFNNEKEFVIIMDLFEDLSYFYYSKDKSFEEGEIRELLIQLNKSFEIMIKNKISIKGFDFHHIISKRHNIKFFYFNYFEYSRINITRKDISKTINPNPYEMASIAPECIEEDEFKDNSVLWSLGIFIYFLFFRDIPYSYNINDLVSIYNIINQSPNLKKTGIKDLDDLIQRSLIKDPCKRISWSDYILHPFLKNKK